ncbi:MAG: tetratricopeptide repeat protein [Deltaproteobacteria bacterium]|nr:tetratricopeptide repeat protein [Deltaproteobacteria bacterium]
MAWCFLAAALGCATGRGATHSNPTTAAPGTPVPPAAPPRAVDEPATPLAPLEDPELRLADELYDARARQDPHDPRADLARARIRQRGGDLAGAARLYRRCLAVDRAFGPGYANYGALLMETDRHQEAVEVLLEGAARAPDHAPIFANLAGVLSFVERHDEALAAAETAIELDPTDADLRRNQVAVLYRAGRLDEAEKALKQAMLEFPDDTADLLMRLSELYTARGEDIKAVETLAKVNRIAPGLVVAWLRRAALLGRAEDLNGCLAVLVDAMRHHADNEEVRGFFMAAMALRLQRDMEEGLARIEKDGHDVDAYILVARVHELGRDHQAALEVLENGVRHNPRSGVLWTQIGVVETSREREREALDAYRRAIKLDPAQHMALNNCAYLLVTAQDGTLRDIDLALSLANGALAQEPTNTAYLDTLAEVQFARGEVRNARETIGRALELEPGDRRLQAQARRFEQSGDSPPPTARSHGRRRTQPSLPPGGE